MGAHSAERADSGPLPATGRLAAARAGDDPTVIAKLSSGFVALGETQLLPGYCLLLADADGAEQLTDLPRRVRGQFLTELGLLGEALAAACVAWDPAFSRVDYEITGDGQQHLRAHVFPRYTWEPAEIRHAPAWQHPASHWADPAHALGSAHDRLIEAITRELSRVLAETS